MLEVKQITKRNDNFSLAVDFSVNNGETLVLLGPSGCGKTTTLNIIAGLVPPESGKISINGQDVTKMPAWKRNMALVFQDLALFPNMDVERNIGYGLFIRGIPKKTRQKTIRDMLDMVHLPRSFAKRKIQTLSGGERQRVAIARSLAFPPHALLMDEPFSSLDHALKEGLWREFKDMHGKAPCVFVTHDLEEAHALGHRLAFMKEGRITGWDFPTANSPKF
ncbi:MAG: ABC transporter ATP-binding protein [Treponema sp.]|jgi:ABC-type Fe3+/spermidine/putrescine transport system ATPase subunit|nr:ABC transporter ATP-binding protein [Treponema sp.]